MEKVKTFIKPAIVFTMIVGGAINDANATAQSTSDYNASSVTVITANERGRVGFFGTYKGEELRLTIAKGEKNVIGSKWIGMHRGKEIVFVKVGRNDFVPKTDVETARTRSIQDAPVTPRQVTTTEVATQRTTPQAPQFTPEPREEEVAAAPAPSQAPSNNNSDQFSKIFRALTGFRRVQDANTAELKALRAAVTALEANIDSIKADVRANGEKQLTQEQLLKILKDNNVDLAKIINDNTAELVSKEHSKRDPWLYIIVFAILSTFGITAFYGTKNENDKTKFKDALKQKAGIKPDGKITSPETQERKENTNPVETSIFKCLNDLYNSK